MTKKSKEFLRRSEASKKGWSRRHARASAAAYPTERVPRGLPKDYKTRGYERKTASGEPLGDSLTYEFRGLGPIQQARLFARFLNDVDRTVAAHPGRKVFVRFHIVTSLEAWLNRFQYTDKQLRDAKLENVKASDELYFWTDRDPVANQQDAYDVAYEIYFGDDTYQAEMAEDEDMEDYNREIYILEAEISW